MTPTPERAHAVATDARFALDRWGVRFADRATEERYLDWSFARLAPTMGVLNLVTVAIMIAVGAAIVYVGGPYLGPLLGCDAIILAACAVIAFAFRRRDRDLALRAAIVSNLTSAVMAVLVGQALSGLAGAGFAVAAGVFTCQFVIGTARERPFFTVLTGALTLFLVLGLRWQAFRDGLLPPVGLLAEAVVLSASLVVALAMARQGDADSRVAYASERTIAEQKETIERERARREEVLQNELAHQVAERSRELGAALARTDVTFDVRQLRPQERFAQRYRILSLLGAGGMGAVYEVERLTDGEKLALKVVVGAVTSASAARFAREAEIGSRLRHPHLVSIVDVGMASGVPFLAMELVRGTSLDSQRTRFGDVAWGLPLLAQIADGLTALHDAGVVHRDLKPANVLLSPLVGDRWLAKISDFGISRFGETDEVNVEGPTMMASGRAAALTGTGMLLGTPLYMAPEAARGGREVGPAADVFALGILAHELLGGRAPFTVPPVLLAMAGEPATPLPLDAPAVPDEVRALLTRAMSNDPAERPSARVFATALHEASRRTGARAPGA